MVVHDISFWDVRELLNRANQIEPELCGLVGSVGPNPPVLVASKLAEPQSRNKISTTILSMFSRFDRI